MPLRLTLRGRLMAIGLLGLAVAIGIGSVTLYAVLWFTGVNTLDRSSAATEAEVAALVDADRLPDPIPVTGSQIVQVVDARQRVVSASVNADRLTSLLQPEELSRALSDPVEVPGSRVGLDSPLRVSAVRAGPEGKQVSVVVAQQFDEVERSARVLRSALLITFPLLLAVLGLIAWRVIGATLRPVEALRAGAERISGSGDRDVLPVPQSDDEVHALAVTLNSMLDRLARSQERQRSFVADVAHELRSPLASMRLQLEVAQRLGEGGELAGELHDDVVRMSGLVEDLLVLARLDADVAPSPAEPVDLVVVVRGLVGRYAGQRVPVVLDAAPAADVVVELGAGELERVLGNLVDNAVRHAVSEVRLSVVPAGARVVVRVDDDGPGIPAADRDRVFERFARLDDARDRDAGGAGLGLAIVREVVRRRGGEARLVDSPHGGLRVEVELPVTRGRADQAGSGRGGEPRE